MKFYRNYIFYSKQWLFYSGTWHGYHLPNCDRRKSQLDLHVNQTVASSKGHWIDSSLWTSQWISPVIPSQTRSCSRKYHWIWDYHSFPGQCVGRRKSACLSRYHWEGIACLDLIIIIQECWCSLHFWNPVHFGFCRAGTQHPGGLWTMFSCGFCQFSNFNVLDAKEMKMQCAFPRAVKHWDYLANCGILPIFFFLSSSVLKNRQLSGLLQQTPALFTCLLYAVYRTQLSKQPVITNMLCKQNWNGGKTDCVRLAFCIANQAEGYSVRVSVCFSPRGTVTHCSVPMLLRGLEAFFFSFCFVKIWYFCRLYWLRCFSGNVKALPINLRK